MKKTYVVCVNHNSDNIYHQVGDVWYGPFTKQAAESLEEKLSNIFMGDSIGSSNSTNRPVAWVLSLTNLTIKEVLAQYRKELLE